MDTDFNVAHILNLKMQKGLVNEAAVQLIVLNKKIRSVE